MKKLLIPPSVPSPPPPSVGKLDSLARVRREMVKVYRDMRQGKIETMDGSRFIFALTAIGRIIEQSDLEARLEKLEKIYEARKTA